MTARTDVPVEDDSTKSKEGSDENEMNDMMGKKEPKEVVFVVNGGKAKMVVVKTGISDDNYLQIKSGVNEGDEVVSGSYRAISRELENGSIVRVEEKHGNNGQGTAENNEN